MNRLLIYVLLMLVSLMVWSQQPKSHSYIDDDWEKFPL